MGQKSMKYKSVIVTRRGSPEVLRIFENDLRAPSAGEARIRILATCVCRPDIQAHYGHTPFAPKIPYPNALLVSPCFGCTHVYDQVRTSGIWGLPAVGAVIPRINPPIIMKIIINLTNIIST